MSLTAVLDSVREDTGYAVRASLKHRTFTLAVLLTLALGIGANSAMFSIVDAVLLRPLPYPSADRLVLVARRTPNGGLRESADARHYLFWRDQQTTLDAIVAIQDGRAVSSDTPDHPERLVQLFVTADFFRVLGMTPVVGRNFLSDEDRPAAPPVVIVSHELWARRFGSDPRIVGQTVRLAGDAFTIVGVAPAGIDPNLSADLWTPRAVESSPMAGGNNFLVLGRLKNGRSREQARANFDVIAAAYQTAHALPTPEHMDVLLYQQWMVAGVQPMLLLLFGVVGFVLLIACANVANLLVARMTDRGQELAIRSALGASRKRLASLVLTECVGLALAGSALGLLFAHVIIDAIVSSSAVRLPRLEQASLDTRVLLFTVAGALLTAILFGVWPAIQAARTEPSPQLQASPRTGADRRTERVRRTLVLVEFALSLVLVVGALLISQSVVKLFAVDIGFDPSRILTAQMTLTGPRYRTARQVAEFATNVAERVRAIPGVTQAAVANALPLANGFNSSFNIPLARVEGLTPPEKGFVDAVSWVAVTPGFFETLGISVRAGRHLSGEDTGSSTPVAVVNETFARRHFANENAIGKRIWLGWRVLGPGHDDASYEIVGVVADIRDVRLQTAPRTTVYVPLPQVNDAVTQVINGTMPTTLFVRAAQPGTLGRATEDGIHGVDPLVPVQEVRAMNQIVGASLSQERFVLWLLGGFAFIAVVLASVGLYGVMAYVVARRTREIGIRSALGATPRDLMTMVLWQGTLVAAAGIVIGTIGSLGLTRLLQSLLFGVTARDPLTFIISPLVLAVVALVAMYVPARRAMRVDPAAALRQA